MIESTTSWLEQAYRTRPIASVDDGQGSFGFIGTIGGGRRGDSQATSKQSIHARIGRL